MSDAFPTSALIAAPGAKAAKVCGILSIVFALTCVGLPVALILGIVALVQQAKAKRLAKAEPQTYAPVPATGLVTGIIGLVLPLLMLPVAGIVGAIAIPALLVQREQARSAAIQHNLDLTQAKAEAAVFAWQARNPGQPTPQGLIIQDLLKDPEVRALKNPVDPKVPAVQSGRANAPGTVMVDADQEQENGITTWSIRLRAVVRRGSEEKTLERQVVTHVQEQVQGRTEDGWMVVNPPTETPAP